MEAKKGLIWTTFKLPKENKNYVVKQIRHELEK
jgi:hypothetical protein